MDLEETLHVGKIVVKQIHLWYNDFGTLWNIQRGIKRYTKEVLTKADIKKISITAIFLTQKHTFQTNVLHCPKNELKHEYLKFFYA